eukprot:m.332237 g.332237  ORF g.332237 m.332237 type:complete len:80 (+) comp16905_c0_seq1:559-798(+)
MGSISVWTTSAHCLQPGPPKHLVKKSVEIQPRWRNENEECNLRFKFYQFPRIESWFMHLYCPLVQIFIVHLPQLLKIKF